VGKQLYLKLFSSKNTKYLKFIIPVICISIALVIVILNLDTLLHPDPIGKKGITEFVLSNKAILYLLLYIGALSLFAVIWIITTFPFSFNGLKKFSGFGVTAEFNEQVNAVVESRSIINEMTAIRENTLNIITSEEFYNDTLAHTVESNGEIDGDMLFNGLLDTIKDVFSKSESKIKIKTHLELVSKDKLDEAKESVKELQNEMAVACNAVIKHERSYLWDKTLAVPITPFDIDTLNNSYYIICLHSEVVQFTDSDVDFIKTLARIVEKLVDLEWYIKTSDDDTEEEASGTGVGAGAD
jgi:hypothetical protein